MPSLLRLMLLEEYRLHVSQTSRRMFMAMPIYVFVLTFFFAGSFPNLQTGLPLGDMLTLALGGIFIYGISVGAFGFLGHTYIERRYGKVNFIIAMPFLLPLSFRSTFFGMYVRDIIFYTVLILGPAFCGLLLASFFAHYALISCLMLFVAMFLSFLFGISLSFAISVLYTRSTLAFGIAVTALGVLMAGFGIFHLYPLGYVLPPIGLELSSTPFMHDPGVVLLYFAVSVIAVVSFTLFAVLLVKQEYESAKSQFVEVFSRYRTMTKFAGRFEALLAKEFVDIVRSGLLKKIGFAYVAPLLFLSFTTWYINNGLKIPVGFNSVFYAGMVGFFGVMLYSWLTNIDLADYFETLPVSVPSVIKGKLLAFFILTSVISTIFVVGISLLNNEMRLLWLALPVLYITGAYMVLATAYLTGLSTNSFLFDPNIMLKFTALALIPDFGITILSLSIDTTPLVSAGGIGIVLVFVALFSWYFYRGIERKWAKQAFT
ncbi:MAG TPA: hypothetical protein VGK23_06800 [Methanomassiliicoccales archaeon]